MSKGTKQLIALCAVLVLCIGGYVGVKLSQNHSARVKEENVIHLGTLEDIVSVSYDHEGERLSFYLDGKRWRYAGDPEHPLDNSHFAKIMQYVVELTASKTITATDSLAAYGLDEPCIFEAEDSKGNTLRLLLGGQAGDGESCYARLEGNDTIYIIDNSLLWYTGKSVDYMTKLDDIPEISDEELGAFAISTKEGMAVIGPGDEKGTDENGNILYYWWVRINDGEPFVLSDKGEALISDVRSLIKNTMWFSACENYKAEEKDFAACGLDKPTLIVTTKWTDGYGDEQTYILNLGDKVDGEAYYYARLDGSNALNTFRELAHDQLVKAVTDLIDYDAKNNKK